MEGKTPLKEVEELLGITFDEEEFEDFERFPDLQTGPDPGTGRAVRCGL